MLTGSAHLYHTTHPSSAGVLQHCFPTEIPLTSTPFLCVGCTYTAGTLPLAGSVCAVYKYATIRDQSAVYLQCTLPGAV